MASTPFPYLVPTHTNINMEVQETLRCLSLSAKLLRRFRQRKILAKFRNAAIVSPMNIFHNGFIHSLRKMEMEILTTNYRDQAILGGEVCNKCKELMCLLLELPRNQLNCSIKLLTGPPEEELQAVTWARSDPIDDRDLSANSGEKNEKWRISNHSAGTAIYGLSPWGRRYPCFSCDNLSDCRGRFDCPRMDWPKYYSSMLVFPMQYAEDKMGTRYMNTGFLCFDSPMKGAFLGLPNIFDFDEPTGYRDKLEQHMHFHFGAILADLLGSAFRSWGSQGTDNPQ